MSDAVPDPYGDRTCYSRFFHRELLTVIKGGVRWCPECFAPTEPETPPAVPETPPSE